MTLPKKKKSPEGRASKTRSLYEGRSEDRPHEIPRLVEGIEDSLPFPRVYGDGIVLESKLVQHLLFGAEDEPAVQQKFSVAITH